MIDDLKMIKKYYGEDMSHLCRSLFSTILEESGELYKIITSKFSPSKFLYNDLVKYNITNIFKDYIYALYKKKDTSISDTIDIDPYTLMKKVGYTLYKCISENDIQNFKKYYASGEELCTFKGDRLNTCYVYFAVKDNASSLKREDFKNPKREDLYGTSVISIQFTKDEAHTLSIKNRYNHTVINPDATYSNNLENIIDGLTNSFAKYEGMYQKNFNDFSIPGYIRDRNGIYYKYNYEINNVYYCPNNVVLDNFDAKIYDKEKYIIIDYFIIDLVNKRITSNYNDGLISLLSNINKIEIINEDKSKKMIINGENKETIIKLDDRNRITSVENSYTTNIEDDFLRYNTTIDNISFPSLLAIGNDFLASNDLLSNINLPYVTTINDRFIAKNIDIKYVNMPMLMTVGDNFLSNNCTLKSIDFPFLESIGNKFIRNNTLINKVNLQELTDVGNEFLFWNNSIRSLNLPNLSNVSDNFLKTNRVLSSIYFPNLESVGDNFLYSNTGIVTLDLPNLKRVGKHFLYYNDSIKRLNIPTICNIDSSFLEILDKGDYIIKNGEIK